MNARNMLKALTLALVVASSAGAAGCTQRTIIEEPVSQDDPSGDPSLTAVATDDSAPNPIANQALYVRSGDTQPGETQTGPFPEPWQQRLGPFPEPWQRQGGDDNDDGKTPPPPNDTNPDPDPNPKP